MTTSLEFRFTVPNEDREEMEVECSMSVEDRITLRYSAWNDGKQSGPSESIHLTVGDGNSRLSVRRFTTERID